MPNEWFLDTSFAVALSSSRDQHHALAAQLAQRTRLQGVRLVTTRAVVIEIGNFLAKAQHRAFAVTLLDVLEGDPNVEIVPVSEELYRESAALFRQHADKEWGITDCISFVIMRQRGLSEVLTADAHFRQAGFTPLLQAS